MKHIRIVVLYVHLCNGKVYSLSGKSKRYPSVDKAYENGVGHPNCKCRFGIYWNPIQLETQDLGVRGDYEEDQKKKAVEREIRRAENDMSLYRMIGNQAEVDKMLNKINRLREKL